MRILNLTKRKTQSTTPIAYSLGPINNQIQWNFIEIHTFSFKKMHLKMSPGKWQPFCLGLNVFIMYKKISYQKVSSSQGRGTLLQLVDGTI